MKATDWTYDREEHERQQLLRDARAPFLEKLRWLEQAHKIVLEMEEQKKRVHQGLSITVSIE